MKYRSTLILLAVVVIAALVAYFVGKGPTTEQVARQQIRLLPDMREQDVTAVEIQSEGRRIVCRRDESDRSRWVIVEPLRLRADRWEVESIIRRFEQAEKQDRPVWLPTADELSEYGLDEPARSVTFRAAAPSERSWTLLVGASTGVGDSVFVAPPDKSAVYTIEGSVAEKLDVTVNDLRSKRLVEGIELADLSGVRLEARERDGQEGFTLACARVDGTWELQEPIRDLADPDAVKGIAERISRHALSRSDFVVDDPTKAADYGLDDPDLSITLKVGETEHSFGFTCRQEGEQEEFYGMNKAEPAIVKVPKTLFEDLRKTPEDLRERSLADFNEEDVHNIVLCRAESTLTLERVDDTWQITGEEPVAADAAAIGDLLDGLRQAQVEQYVEDEPEDVARYGLGADELWRVTLKDADDEILAEVLFGAEDEAGEHVFARRAAYAPVLSVKKERYVADLRRGRLAFLDRLVLDEPAEKGVRVRLAYDGEEFVCEREDEDADWELVKPVRERADTAAVDGLLRAFAHLEAEGYAAESASDLAPYGLDDPALVAEVTYRKEEPEGESEAGGEQSYVRQLLVGAASKDGPEGLCATLAGDARVFILGQDVVERLRATLASRVICDADQPEELTFRWEGESRSFVYDKDELAWRAAGEEAAPQELIDRVKKAARLLEGFNGVRIADYVEKDPAAYGFDRPALTIVLKDKAAAGKTVVLGKQTDDGDRYAKGPATSFVLVASQADAETLLAVLQALKGESE